MASLKQLRFTPKNIQTLGVICLYTATSTHKFNRSEKASIQIYKWRTPFGMTFSEAMSQKCFPKLPPFIGHFPNSLRVKTCYGQLKFGQNSKFTIELLTQVPSCTQKTAKQKQFPQFLSSLLLFFTQTKPLMQSPFFCFLHDYHEKTVDNFNFLIICPFGIDL